jgi:hypothetical protein
MISGLPHYVTYQLSLKSLAVHIYWETDELQNVKFVKTQKLLFFAANANASARATNTQKLFSPLWRGYEYR